MSLDVNIVALQYALRELSVAETAAFETRLEHDQAAREALADAVVLMAAVQRLPRQTVTRSSTAKTSSRSRLLAVIVGTAACLSMALVMRMTHRESAAIAADETTILQTWSDLGPDDGLAIDMDGIASTDDAHAEIPDWMVAAVLNEVDAPPANEGTL